MEKRNIKENQFHCPNCSCTYSFKTGEIAVKEVRKMEKRAGNSKER
jgi:hypothetical protein